MSTHSKSPVFPVMTKLLKRSDGFIAEYEHKSLDKRELFAAMAMQGIISSYTTGLENPLITAQYAIKYADLLIDQLNKK